MLGKVSLDVSKCCGDPFLKFSSLKGQHFVIERYREDLKHEILVLFSAVKQ